MLQTARVALFAVLMLASRCVETEGHSLSDADVACGAACSGSRPVCDEATGTCVECVAPSDCDEDAPSCDVETHRCFACSASEPCTSAGAAYCDESTGACGACRSNDDCAGFAGTPVCDVPSGRCVECTRATEAQRCGDRFCSLATNTCTSTVRGNVTRCGECEADSECSVGHVCVERRSGAQALGSYCMPLRPEAGCGATSSNPSMLPFSTTFEATTVDGIADTICDLRSTISCEGYRRIGIECAVPGTGTQSDVCGSTVLHDGHCHQPSVPDSPRCSYACLEASDCKSGFNCEIATGGSTTVCR